MKVDMKKNLAILKGLASLCIIALISLLAATACTMPIAEYPAASEELLPAEERASTASPQDFREESIYFLLPARFYDGDSSNNVPNEWCSYGPNSPAITDPADVTWRGDFKGLINGGLQYIKDLGFTAVWITPIVQNRGPLDYHGYHAWDFTKVDPRLESPGATYQDFINKAHELGLKVVQDIVLNHSGRYGVKGQSELKYNTDPAQPWGKDKNGNVLVDNPNWEYDGITPNPADGKIWSRANLAKMPAPYNANLAAYNWPGTEAFINTSDITWFHHSGNGFAQGWDDIVNLYDRALADDCPDLNTESQAVRDYLVAAYKKYIDMGVDAFRVDTVKHMDRASVQYFVDQFKAYAPNLFIVGEVAQKRHELHSVEEINPHWYTWKGAVGNSANSGMAILDFYAEATFHGVFEEDRNLGEITAAARYDHLYSDPSTNVTWLDNHDFGPNNDWDRRYSGDDEGMATYFNFASTWRGIPSLYYGSEIQFMRGARADIKGEPMTKTSLDITGRAYYGANIATASSHKLYQHIKKMNAIRKAIPALQKGTWTWAGNPSNGNGIGYTRSYNGVTVCVGLAKNGSVSFNFTGIPSGTYRDAVTGSSLNSSGSISFTVSGGSAGIYVLNGPGMIGALGAGFFQTNGNYDTDWTECYLRGTPNAWGASPMKKNSATGLWEITATFGSDSPRFKISHYANNWNEAFPDKDQLITEGAGDYDISFNEKTKAISAVKRTSNLYSISGSITKDGVALQGVLVTLNTGATATSSQTGSFTFTNLANNSYTLTPSMSAHSFSPSTKSVTIAGANVSGQNFTASQNGFISTYASMGLRGSMNAWANKAMTLTANYTWETDVSLTGGTTYTYKYDVAGNWVTNFGIGSSAGIAAQNGNNLSFTPSATGTYTFKFIDNTKAYSVIPKDTLETPNMNIIQSITKNSMKVLWIGVPNATSYTLYRSLSAESGYAAIVTQAGWEFADSGLLPDTTYYYKVMASNATSSSGLSHYISGKTLPDGNVVPGRLTVIFKTGSNAENVSFPGDANSWILTANTLSLGANASSNVVWNGGISALSLARGNSTTAIELKLVTNASWNNQWSFATWTKSANISLQDSSRQILIPCTSANEVVLTIDVGARSLSAVVK